MTKINSENPVYVDAGDDLPSRIRKARENVGLSRAELSRRTGIPPKAIEKFEYGQQEPSVSRLRTLCRELGSDFESMMGGLEEDSDGGASIAVKPSHRPVHPSPHPSNTTDDPEAEVRRLLKCVDDLRSEAFEDGRRMGMALTDDLKNSLRYLEPDELLSVAEKRGVRTLDCPDAISIMALFSDDPADAQNQCGDVEERIIDTAVLGADLFGIERDALAVLADHLQEMHEMERPGLFSWGSHRELVTTLRPVLRTLAFAGNAIKLDDRKAFPQRR